MPFRFKYFEVEDEKSTLRVSTDAMLLGSWAEPGKAGTILDIGTGCGVLALMMSQKSEAIIDAIDVDHLSIEQARQNFMKSPWSKRLNARHCSLQEFSSDFEKCYDFIITNPPFFSDSLKSHSERKNKARHEIELSHADLLEGAAKLLKTDGFLSLILPSGMGTAIEKEAEKSALYLSHSMLVRTLEDHPPKRILLKFTPKKVNSVRREEMFILDKQHAFSEFYLQITREFHQF